MHAPILSILSYFSHLQLAFEFARKARDTFKSLLLPGVQQNHLHPFGGVNTR